MLAGRKSAKPQRTSGALVFIRNGLAIGYLNRGYDSLTTFRQKNSGPTSNAEPSGRRHRRTCCQPWSNSADINRRAPCPGFRSRPCLPQCRIPIIKQRPETPRNMRNGESVNHSESPQPGPTHIPIGPIGSHWPRYRPHTLPDRVCQSTFSALATANGSKAASRSNSDSSSKRIRSLRSDKN